MNGDIATKAATRSSDPVQFRSPPPEGHKYCWLCSTYKSPAAVTFGGRCWDCMHSASRHAAARTAIGFLNAGKRHTALLALAIALDAQARAEGIQLPVHQTVTRHAHRAIFRDSLERTDHLRRAVTP